MAGALGGLPSIVLLSKHDLAASTRAIAHLVPGNQRVRSPIMRFLLGGAVHMGISLTFATLYCCLIRRRPLIYGLVLWAVNLKLLAPRAVRDEDKSHALADHLVWAAMVGWLDRYLGDRATRAA
ncbi:MAG TPA: hypothetical protein VND22_00565 [Actinomycetota bacterium]|nr:hypothetical protein [Actinomycetota bacterium]